jgi:hypothetical protein
MSSGLVITTPFLSQKRIVQPVKTLTCPTPKMKRSLLDIRVTISYPHKRFPTIEARCYFALHGSLRVRRANKREGHPRSASEGSTRIIPLTIFARRSGFPAQHCSAMSERQRRHQIDPNNYTEISRRILGFTLSDKLCLFWKAKNTCKRG